MTDPHVVRDGDAPTPFAADEIRAACLESHTLHTVTEEAGEVVGRSRIDFVGVDAEGATMRSTPVGEAGEPLADPVERRAAWTDLQAHASFPAAVTARVDDVLDGPLGSLHCRRYEVRGDPDVMVFWFAFDHPGMPIRYEIRRDEEVVSITSVVSAGAVRPFA
jgi:hypothetical protein